MKIIMVYITLFLSCATFLIVTDLLSGIKLPVAIHILFKSFSVLTGADYLILIVSLAIPFVPVLASRLKNRIFAENKSNSSN